MKCGTSSSANRPSKPARGESSDLIADGRQWVWISFAPEFRLILAALLATEFDSALQLIQMTARCLGRPVLFQRWIQLLPRGTDQNLHTLKTFPRTGKPGRPKQPVKEPHPDLSMGRCQKEAPAGSKNSSTVYAACQTLRGTRLSISTSLLERLNLTLRQHCRLCCVTVELLKDRTHMSACVLFQLSTTRPTAYEFTCASV